MTTVSTQRPWPGLPKASTHGHPGAAGALTQQDQQLGEGAVPPDAHPGGH